MRRDGSARGTVDMGAYAPHETTEERKVMDSRILRLAHETPNDPFGGIGSRNPCISRYGR